MSSLVAKSLKEILTFTRASTARYFDIDGVMTTAEVDEPRIEYDPVTLAVRGLLIEEERTNLLLDSAVLATQSVAVTAEAHTLSFYGTGTVTLSGASTAGPLAGTGDLERVSLVFTPSAGSLTLTVSGSVTAAQLEAGAMATSYILTTSTAATRAADICTATALNPWFNEDEGTVFAEYLVPWTHDAANTFARRIVEINDGSADNRHIPAYIDAGLRKAVTTDETAAQAAFSLTAFTAGTVQKQAYAWAEDDIAVAASGGQFSTDTAATMPTGLTTFHLGAAYAPNAYLRKVKFYPRRLSDNELRALVA